MEVTSGAAGGVLSEAATQKCQVPAPAQFLQAQLNTVSAPTQLVVVHCRHAAARLLNRCPRALRHAADLRQGKGASERGGLDASSKQLLTVKKQPSHPSNQLVQQCNCCCPARCQPLPSMQVHQPSGHHPAMPQQCCHNRAHQAAPTAHPQTCLQVHRLGEAGCAAPQQPHAPPHLPAHAVAVAQVLLTERRKGAVWAGNE